MSTEDDKREPPAFVTVPRGSDDALTTCTCAEYQTAGYCPHVRQHDDIELDAQVEAIELKAEAVRLLLALDGDEEKLTALLRQFVLLRHGLVPFWCDN